MNRVLGRLILATVAYVFAVILAVHVLQPQFSPMRTPISAHVNGPYGAWVVTTYFAMAVSLLAIAWGVPPTLPRRPLVRVAAALFVLAAAGTLLAGIFPMDPARSPATTAGQLHKVGGSISFPARVVATLLFSLSFRRDPYWGPAARRLLGIALAAVSVFVFAIVSIATLGYAGYAQRPLIALLLTWTAVVGVRLSRLPGDAAVSAAVA